MTPSRSYRVAVAGPTIWLQTRTVAGPSPGRLTGAALTALILMEWGDPVTFVSLIGDDDDGEHARAALAAAGVDLTWLMTRPGQPTAHRAVTVDDRGNEAPVAARPGPQLARGDRLDIYELFSHDLVLLDQDDFALRQFLVDLPAHTVPTTRILGTLSGLAASSDPARLRVALAHDAIVGTEAEFLALTGTAMLDDGLTTFQQAMRISNLRAALLLTSKGTTMLTPAARSDLDAAVPMPMSASVRAALLAGIAFGMVRRWPWEQVVPFATMAATLLQRMQANQSVPSLDQLSALLHLDPATLNP